MDFPAFSPRRINSPNLYDHQDLRCWGCWAVATCPGTASVLSPEFPRGGYHDRKGWEGCPPVALVWHCLQVVIWAQSFRCFPILASWNSCIFPIQWTLGLPQSLFDTSLSPCFRWKINKIIIDSPPLTHRVMTNDPGSPLEPPRPTSRQRWNTSSGASPGLGK